MTDIAAFYIPRCLDEPEKILFWSLDEVGIIIVPFLVGIIVGHTIIGMIIGILLYTKWRKLKGTGSSNLIIYATYWYLPSFVTSLKATPLSHYRLYLG